MKILSGPRPPHFDEVATLLESVGIPEVLACIAAYAHEKYDEAVTARINVAEEERAKLDGISASFWSRDADTQLDRESYRWMHLFDLSRVASTYEEDTRKAAMSDEDLRAEEQAACIKKAEEALEAARSGKRCA